MKKLLVLFLFLGISSVGFFLSPKEASTANPGVRTNTARAPITIINYYNQQMGFYESLPKGYNDDPAREWPLIIFLHGDGERGNGTTELSRVLGAGLPKVINEGAQLEYTVNGKLDSFVVIAPQLDAGSSEWHPYQVDAFIEYAKENYRIDTDRIYLTGLSLGAFGAHRYPKFSPAFAQKIAAVVATDGADAGTSIYTPDYPGGMAPLDACFVPANNVKTWFIWGDADGWIWTVNGALAALAACTPSAAPTKTTVYPGLGHGVWTQTYDPTNSYQTPNTYEWLLAQTRGTAPTPTPVPGNQAPTASAGSDQAITLPTSTVTLSGSGADADGIITSYVWTKVSGGAATIVSATTASTQVTGLVEGAYVFRLTVTDSSGGTATDEVQIAVTTAVTLMDPAARRIVITPEMLFNETLVGNEEKLFNEQGTLVLDASGNPLQTTRPAACKGVWEEPPVDRTCFHVNDTNSNKELAYPGKIIVDLGRTYKITDIYLYDDRGGTHAAGDTEPLQVWTGGPLKYTQKIATHNFEKENEWVRLSVTPTETRYLQLRFNDGHGFIGEVVLYGVPMGSTPSTAAVPTIKPNYTFEKMIGTNISFGMGQDANGTKYDDQWGTVRYFGGLRWTFDKNDNLTPLDGIALETITRMVQKGVGVYSVLMGAAWTMVDPTDPLYISEAYTSFSDRKAIDYTLCAGSKIVGGLPSCDTVAQDPASYAHKAWLSKRVAKRDYDLGVRMIELGNEPDGFWQNAGYYLPFETAAMVSADYDGHCNTLRYRGETVGVKNAAPGMKVVLPAVSQHDPRYLKAMEFWFEHNRPCAPTFPADVINFHTYATTLGYQFAGNTGVSMPPEAFGIREQSESFVQFRNRYAPHAEVAMSEFGVDTYYEQHPNPTHPWCGSTVYGNSWAYAPKVGPFDEKEVQGQWLARSYLEQAAAGLDFVNQFWLSDQYREEESCFTFTTAGVLRITNVTDYKPTYEPKVSWYYTQTLRTRLAGMQYESEKNVSNGLGTGTIRIMKFRSVATPSAVAYVLWSPTANNVTNPNFVLSLDTAASASVIELTKGSETGVVLSATAASASAVPVSVSERPIIVLANEDGTPTVPVDQTPVVPVTPPSSSGGSSGSRGGSSPSAPVKQGGGAPAQIAVTQSARERVRINVRTALRVRLAPNGAVIGSVAGGILADVVQRLGTWVKIRFDNGAEGWIAAPFATTISAPTLSHPAQTLSVAGGARVSINVSTTLKIRATPGGTLTARANGGTVATVLERGVYSGGVEWVKLRFATGLEGWVVGMYLKPITAPGGAAALNSSVRSTAVLLNVRSAPGGAVAGTVPMGTTGTIVSGTANGNWIQVRFSNGVVGYVNRSYLRDN